MSTLRQGLNYNLDAHEVGVMNVYDDGDGVVAQLALFEPAAGGSVELAPT